MKMRMRCPWMDASGSGTLYGRPLTPGRCPNEAFGLAAVSRTCVTFTDVGGDALLYQVLIQIMCLHGNQFSGHYRQVGCYREVAAKTGLTVYILKMMVSGKAKKLIAALQLKW